MEKSCKGSINDVMTDFYDEMNEDEETMGKVVHIISKYSRTPL